MAKGKRIEGPRAPLFFSTASVAMLALLSSYSANSQTVEVSTLEQCFALETEALKLRCFEAIIASSETDTDEVAPVPEPPVAASSPEEAIQATADLVKAVPAVSASAAPIAEVATATVPAATPAVTPNAAVAPVVEVAGIDGDSDLSAVAANEPVSEDFIGKEHLAPQTPKNDADGRLLRATVIEVSKGRNGILFFTLGNGQVWRQIEARHFNYPKNTEFEVNINRGMMGEYRMRIGDKSQMVRIRRVK